MAIVDGTGVRGQSLSEHLADLEARFRAAFGADFALDPETPQGQIAGIWAQVLVEHDEQVVAQGNALSVDHAVGVQLDDLGSNLGIVRGGATRSTVTATLTGVAGTRVPAGSRARTAAGAQFALDADAVLSPSGVGAEMTAVDTGPVAAAAGELSIIVTLVPGWETIRNAAGASVGVAAETDRLFRARYQARTANSADGPIDALRAALKEAGATRSRIIENPSSAVATVGGYDLQPYSVIVVVEGGTDAAISEAVLSAKGMGVSPMTEYVGGDHSDLATIRALGATAAITYGTQTGTVDAAGAANLAAIADGVEALIRSDGATPIIRQTQVAYDWQVDGYYRVLIPWRSAYTLPLSGALPDALGLSSPATSPQGPFVRANPRALAVTAAVTIDRTEFPADGLADMRRRLIERVGQYEIGQGVWANDLLCEIEAIPGTRVTSLSATDAGTDASGVAIPASGYYTLAESAVSITLTQS